MKVTPSNKRQDLTLWARQQNRSLLVTKIFIFLFCGTTSMKMNNSSFEETESTFDHFSGTRELYKILFAVLDSVGIGGNLVVIFTILLNRSMRSGVYLLLCNLAISDLIFAILVTFHINQLMENYNWQFGATFCKIYFFSYRLLYTVSMLNLIVITVQRYRATKYPIAFRFQRRRTNTLIISCWVLGVLISSPFLFVMKHISFGEQNNRCFQQWPNERTRQVYYICIYIFVYILPFVLMTMLYVMMFVTLRKPYVGDANETQQRQLKKRKKISLIVGIIVLMFFICWTPRTVLEFILIMDLTFGNKNRLATASNYSLLAVVMSTAVNPILFNFMSSDFREGFKSLFRHCSCHDSETTSPNVGSAATGGNPELQLGSPNAQVNRIVVGNTNC